MNNLAPALLLSCLLVLPALRRAQEVNPKPSQSDQKHATKTEEGKRREAGEPQADDEEVLSIETPLVTVPVRVVDRQGRSVTDLRREDFRLYEDGVEQEVSFFETADQPFTVALLLDMSDSAKFKREEIQAAARAFVELLRPADRVMLVAFDKRVRVLAEPTGDRAALYRAISAAQTGGGTSLYDAVRESIAGRFGRERGRKAIVLLTDGVDTTSRATSDATMRAAEEFDALTYVIQYDTIDDAATAQLDPLSRGQTVLDLITPKGERLSAAYKRAGLFLRALADKTGGRFYQAETVKRLSGSLARIAAELREQYGLGFYPKNRAQDGKARRLKVRVERAGVAVFSRRAYIFGPRKKARRQLDAEGRLSA